MKYQFGVSQRNISGHAGDQETLLDSWDSMRKSHPSLSRGTEFTRRPLFIHPPPWQRARPDPMGKAATRPVAAATTAAATRPADSVRARLAGPDPTAQKVGGRDTGQRQEDGGGVVWVQQVTEGSRAVPHLPLRVFSPRMPGWVLRSRLPAAVLVPERSHLQQD